MDQGPSALREAFDSFLVKAEDVLSWDFSGDEVYKIIGPPSRLTQFSRLVSDLHASREHATLVGASAEFFKSYGHGPSRASWHVAISGFFSEYSVYQSLENSQVPDKSALFEKFVEYFKREFEIVTVLVPLHGLRLPFDKFESHDYSIERFTAEHLSAYIDPTYQLLEHDFEQVLSFISGYWYLVIKIREIVFPVGSLVFRERDHELPERAVEILESLSLLEPRDPFGRDAIELALDRGIGVGSYPPRLRTPFVLRLRNNRASAPAQLIGLVHRLYGDEEVEEYLDEEGNVEDVGPSHFTSFSKADTDFVSECLRLHDGIERIRVAGRVNGKFLIRALYFLYRGAASEEASEALLWNVMVLESLFGVEGITSRSIVKGLSHVYRSHPEKADRVIAYFKRGKKGDFENTGLYDLRSKLLHGEALPSDLALRHVVLSRLIARDSVEWTIKLLLEVDSIMSENKEKAIFEREHFLSLLQSPIDNLTLHKLIVHRLF